MSQLSRGLFSSEVAVEEADPRELRDVDAALLEGEAAAVERAVLKRRQQYATGRLCARRALQRLGMVSAMPIISGADRAPLWPPGFTGSISHTDDWCAVVVARREHVRSLGLDVEQARPLSDPLVAKICVPEEQQWLRSLPESERGTMGKLIFSAKECAYKCQYPLTTQYLGFDAIQIQFDLEARTFVAVFRKPAGEFRPGDTIPGRFIVERSLVLTGCSLVNETAP